MSTNWVYNHHPVWSTGLDGLNDLGVTSGDILFLVDSDCILYPTAFSRVTDQGPMIAAETARMKLMAKLAAADYNPYHERHKVVQIFTSSGSPKYRDQFIKQVPYKASRKTKTGPQPMYVEEIRNELFQHSDCILAHPEVGEADDYISVLANTTWRKFGKASIIIGDDKDLLQIPGLHFRGTVNKTIVDINMAARSFYRQILSGDTADCIPGLKGVGPKIAKNLIPDHITSEEQMFDIVVKEYSKRHPGTIDEITDYLFETGNLLYLRRDFDDHWNPPIV